MGCRIAIKTVGAMGFAAMQLLLLLFGSAAGTAQDGTPPKGYSFCGQGVVGDVLSGNRMRLVDGTLLTLDMLQAPMIAREGQIFDPWPLAQWAKGQVRDQVMGKTLTLYCAGDSFDRYGERFAAVYWDGGRWLQAEMIKAGLARVKLTRASKTLSQTLYGLEDTARRAGRGLWGNRAYAVVEASNPAAISEGRFMVIRGRVLSHEISDKITYINFGTDLRKDFTLEASAKVSRAFERTGVDLPFLKGRLLEVRGWVDHKNGPRITLSHPSQLRLLDTPSAP